MSRSTLPDCVAPICFAVACLAAPSLAQPGPVPAPEGTRLLLTLGADGVQNYACEVRDGAHAWVFKGPEARLFDTAGRQVGTHGAGPFWRLAADNSAVIGEVAANAPAPKPGAIPWLLLRAKSHEGTGALRQVAWIRRIDTQGGVAPSGGCDASRVGEVAQIRYSADYQYFAAAP